MNIVCSGVSDPASFSTDDTVAPVATRIVVARHDGGEDPELRLNGSSNGGVSSPTNRRRRGPGSPNAAPLLVRFVRARLLHLQLNLLSKIGGGVSELDNRPGTPSQQELLDADDLFDSVREEISALGPELVSREIALVDADFTQALKDAGDRVSELQSTAGVRSSTWYGAACQQVEDNARLLVANRKLERENTLLVRQNQGLADKLERLTAAKEAAKAQHVQEMTIQRQRGDAKSGGASASLTAKLQADLAMKEAERAAGNNNNNNSSDGSDKSADMAKVEVARSLRLQDEVVVLRKATTTLQLSLSRVQHQYSSLLDEHEKLKAEIRNVVAQQDAEENDIRRIFVEREREFEVAMKAVASLKKKLESTEKQNSRLQRVVQAHQSINGAAAVHSEKKSLTREQSNLQLLKARSDTSKFERRRNSLFPGVPIEDDNDNEEEEDLSASAKHGSSFRYNNPDADGNKNSLAARMKAVRAKTVPTLTTAFSSPQPDMDKILASDDDDDDDETESDGEDVMDEAKSQEDDPNIPPPPPDDDIFTEPLDPTMMVDLDDEAQQVESGNESEEEQDQQQQIRRKSSVTIVTSQPDVAAPVVAKKKAIHRVHISTMTDAPRKGPAPVTVATQTFIKPPVRELSSSNNKKESISSTSSSPLLSRPNEIGAAAAAAAASSSPSAEAAQQLLDKLTRLVNRQSNVIERFLGESVTSNVLLRRRDLARLLKQFGIPVGGEDNVSSSSNNAATWQGVLHRFPLSSSSSALESEVDAALGQAIASLTKPAADASAQTDEGGGLDDFSAAGRSTPSRHGSAAARARSPSSHHHHHHRPSSSSFPGANAVLPTSFWNANDAVNALRRVYLDAGRLIDTVEREKEVVEQQQQQQHDGGGGAAGDATLSNESPSVTGRAVRPASAAASRSPAAGSGAAAAAAAAAAATPSSSSTTATPTAAAAVVVERVATEQFFAIRALEGSCNLLVQRLNSAKEEYVRRFAERSSLLNQTLGQVSRTHPREANRLSRLAKSVKEARAVVPWMTGFVEHFDAGGAVHHQAAAAVPIQAPPLVFRASDIIMGKLHPALSSSPSAGSSSHHFSA